MRRATSPTDRHALLGRDLGGDVEDFLDRLQSPSLPTVQGDRLRTHAMGIT